MDSNRIGSSGRTGNVRGSSGSGSGAVDHDVQKALDDYISKMYPGATPEDQMAMAEALVQYTKDHSASVDTIGRSLETLKGLYPHDDFYKLISDHLTPLVDVYLKYHDHLDGHPGPGMSYPGIDGVLNTLKGQDPDTLSTSLDIYSQLEPTSIPSDQIIGRINDILSMEGQLKEMFPDESSEFFEKWENKMVESTKNGFVVNNPANAITELAEFQINNLDLGTIGPGDSPDLDKIIKDMLAIIGDNNPNVNHLYAVVLAKLKDVNVDNTADFNAQIDALIATVRNAESADCKAAYLKELHRIMTTDYPGIPYDSGSDYGQLLEGVFKLSFENALSQGKSIKDALDAATASVIQSANYIGSSDLSVKAVLTKFAAEIKGKLDKFVPSIPANSIIDMLDTLKGINPMGLRSGLIQFMEGAIDKDGKIDLARGLVQLDDRLEDILNDPVFHADNAPRIDKLGVFMNYAGFVEEARKKFPGESNEFYNDLYKISIDPRLPYITSPEDAYMDYNFKKITGADLKEPELKALNEMQVDLSKLTPSDMNDLTRYLQGLMDLSPLPAGYTKPDGTNVPMDMVNILNGILRESGWTKDAVTGGYTGPAPDHKKLTGAQYNALLTKFQEQYLKYADNQNVPSDERIRSALGGVLIMSDPSVPGGTFGDIIGSAAKDKLLGMVSQLKGLQDIRKMESSFSMEMKNLEKLIRQNCSVPSNLKSVNVGKAPGIDLLPYPAAFPLETKGHADVVGAFMVIVAKSSIRDDGSIEVDRGSQKLNKLIDLIKADSGGRLPALDDILKLPELNYSDSVILGDFIEEAKKEFPGETDDFYAKLYEIYKGDRSITSIHDAYMDYMYKTMTGHDLTAADIQTLKDLGLRIEDLSKLSADDLKQVLNYMDILTRLSPFPAYLFNNDGAVLSMDVRNIIKDVLLKNGWKVNPDGSYTKPNGESVTKAQFEEMLKEIGTFYNKAFTDAKTKNPPVEMDALKALKIALTGQGLSDSDIDSINAVAQQLDALKDLEHYDYGHAPDFINFLKEINTVKIDYRLDNPHEGLLPDGAFPLGGDSSQVSAGTLDYMLILTKLSIRDDGSIDMDKGLQKLNKIIELMKIDSRDGKTPNIDEALKSPYINYSDTVISLLDGMKGTKNIFLIVFAVMVKYAEQKRLDLNKKMDELKVEKDKYEDLTAQIKKANDDYAAHKTDANKAKVDNLNADLNVQSNKVNQAVSAVQNANSTYVTANKQCTDILSQMQTSEGQLIRNLM